MKKTILGICISIPIIALFLILSSYSTFCSRAKSLDEFRKHEENKQYYEGSIIVHTEEIEGNYWDFIINKDILHVLRIRVDKEWGTKVYLLSSYTSGSFSSGVNDKSSHYKQTEELKFNKESNLTMKLLHTNTNIHWCFMDNTFVNTEESVKAYPFTYQDKNYVLYIKHEEIKN